MSLAIMQPYFFPYIGYFQLIQAVDKIILYDYVNFIKKGWVNRNRVVQINKGPVFITAPIKKASSNKRIDEIELDNSTQWQAKLLDMLRHNYRKMPYFDEFFPILTDLLNQNHEQINTLNFEIISSIATLLEIDTEIECGSDKYHTMEFDLLMNEFPIAKKDQRIINICRAEKNSNYINPIGGVEIYSKEVFKQEGVNLQFLQTNNIEYQQPTKEFHPYLSIVDMLFCCGIDNTKLHLNNYQLL